MSVYVYENVNKFSMLQGHTRSTHICRTHSRKWRVYLDARRKTGDFDTEKDTAAAASVRVSVCMAVLRQIGREYSALCDYTTSKSTSY